MPSRCLLSGVLLLAWSPAMHAAPSGHSPAPAVLQPAGDAVWGMYSALNANWGAYGQSDFAGSFNHDIALWETSSMKLHPSQSCPPGCVPIGVRVHGDPMFHAAGSSSHFWLTENSLTPLLSWPDISGRGQLSLAGKTFGHRSAGSQWFDQFVLSSTHWHAFLNVTIQDGRLRASLDGNELVHGVGNSGRRPLVASIQDKDLYITAGGLPLRVYASDATKFANRDEQRKYAHLNLEIRADIPDHASGIFAELAGVRPMSEATRALTRNRIEGSGSHETLEGVVLLRATDRSKHEVECPVGCIPDPSGLKPSPLVPATLPPPGSLQPPAPTSPPLTAQPDSLPESPRQPPTPPAPLLPPAGPCAACNSVEGCSIELVDSNASHSGVLLNPSVMIVGQSLMIVARRLHYGRRSIELEHGQASATIWNSSVDVGWVSLDELLQSVGDCARDLLQVSFEHVQTDADGLFPCMPDEPANQTNRTDQFLLVALGPEDPRVFECCGGQKYMLDFRMPMSSTPMTSCSSQCGRMQPHLSPIDEEALGHQQLRLGASQRLLYANRECDASSSEKNWAPLPNDDRMLVTRSFSPAHEVLDVVPPVYSTSYASSQTIPSLQYSTEEHRTAKDLADAGTPIRGGSPFVVITHSARGKQLLAIVHTRATKQGKLKYENRAITVEPFPPFKETFVGPPLPLDCTASPMSAARDDRVCFASGLLVYDNKVLVAYGSGDQHAMLWSQPWALFERHYLTPMTETLELQASESWAATPPIAMSAATAMATNNGVTYTAPLLIADTISNKSITVSVPADPIANTKPIRTVITTAISTTVATATPIAAPMLTPTPSPTPTPTLTPTPTPTPKSSMLDHMATNGLLHQYDACSSARPLPSCSSVDLSFSFPAGVFPSDVHLLVFGPADILGIVGAIAGVADFEGKLERTSMQVFSQCSPYHRVPPEHVNWYLDKVHSYGGCNAAAGPQEQKQRWEYGSNSSTCRAGPGVSRYDFVGGGRMTTVVNEAFMQDPTWLASWLEEHNFTHVWHMPSETYEAYENKCARERIYRWGKYDEKSAKIRAQTRYIPSRIDCETHISQGSRFVWPTSEHFWNAQHRNMSTALWSSASSLRSAEQDYVTCSRQQSSFQTIGSYLETRGFRRHLLSLVTWLMPTGRVRGADDTSPGVHFLRPAYDAFGSTMCAYQNLAQLPFARGGCADSHRCNQTYGERICAVACENASHCRPGPALLMAADLVSRLVPATQSSASRPASSVTLRSKESSWSKATSRASGTQPPSQKKPFCNPLQQPLADVMPPISPEDEEAEQQCVHALGTADLFGSTCNQHVQWSITEDNATRAEGFSDVLNQVWLPECAALACLGCDVRHLWTFSDCSSARAPAGHPYAAHEPAVLMSGTRTGSNYLLPLFRCHGIAAETEKCFDSEVLELIRQGSYEEDDVSPSKEWWNPGLLVNSTTSQFSMQAEECLRDNNYLVITAKPHVELVQEENSPIKVTASPQHKMSTRRS